MGSYYYLGAQLPYLVYGQSPPMRSIDFRELALKHMSSGDAALLDQCTLDPDPPEVIEGDLADETPAADINTSVTPAAGAPADAAPEGGISYADPAPRLSSTLINRWRTWERALRLNLARNRALVLKREAVDAPESPLNAVNAAKNALNFESPLEAELFLDKARWDAIEVFQGISYFSEKMIFAYFLKLKLMERRQVFNAEEGFLEYKSLYASILGKMENAGEPI